MKAYIERQKEKYRQQRLKHQNSHFQLKLDDDKDVKEENKERKKLMR